MPRRSLSRLGNRLLVTRAYAIDTRCERSVSNLALERFEVSSEKVTEQREVSTNIGDSRLILLRAELFVGFAGRSGRRMRA